VASNGNLSSADLTNLSTPGQLTDAAAASYERLLDATDTTGTEGRLDAYRDYQDQVDLFTTNYQTAYCEYSPGKVDARTWDGDTWYRKPGKNATAVPGTSNHGWGKAVDFQNLGGYGSSSWERFADAAEAEGWSNQEGRANDEPWHWVFGGSTSGGDEVELSDKITISDAMKDMAGWDADEVSVESILGYLASGMWGTAKELDGAGPRLDRMEEQINAILAIQEDLKEALADLTVNVDLEVRPLLGALTIEMSGTVTQPEEQLEAGPDLP